MFSSSQKTAYLRIKFPSKGELVFEKTQGQNFMKIMKIRKDYHLSSDSMLSYKPEQFDCVTMDS